VHGKNCDPLEFLRAPSGRRATRPPKQRGEQEASPPRRTERRVRSLFALEFTAYLTFLAALLERC